VRRLLPPIGPWAARHEVSPHRSAIIGSAVITMAQTTATLVFALASIYLVRTLSTHEFGRATFGINAHLLLLTLAGFGLTTGVMAEIARGRGSGGIAWPAVQTLALVRLATAVPLITIGLVWASAAMDIVPAIAAVAASLFVMLDFLVGVLAGQLRSRAVAAILVSQPASYALLLVVLRASTAESVLIVMVFALACSLTLAVGLQSSTVFSWFGRPAIDLAPLGHALWVARYAYLLTFLQMGLVVLPIVLFGTLNRFAQGAALSITMTLVRFVPEALSLMIVSAYFPRLRALPAEGTARTVLFNGYAKVVGLAAVPGVLGLAILGEPLLDVLFAGRYNYLAPDLAVASLLVIVLPIEALLTWTLVTDGVARTAVLALAVRLIAVLAACVAFLVMDTDARSLGALILSYPIASMISVGILLARGRRIRELRLPLYHHAFYAVACAAAFVAIRVLLGGTESSALTLAAAAVSCVPLGALGAWLTSH
jgi:O-antigen/teichoic acid export membrane protein